jgi:hypothetical protein
MTGGGAVAVPLSPLPISTPIKSIAPSTAIPPTAASGV